MGRVGKPRDMSPADDDRAPGPDRGTGQRQDRRPVPPGHEIPETDAGWDEGPPRPPAAEEAAGDDDDDADEGDGSA
jgi:hypothetical protein